MIRNRPLPWLLGVALLGALSAPARAQHTFSNPDQHVSQTFHLDRRVTGPDGRDYRVLGDLHVVLDTRFNGPDRAEGPVEIQGQANTEGITVNQVNGPRSYRAVGSAPIEHSPERSRHRATHLSTRLRYGLVNQGDGPNYGLVILLRGQLNAQGALTVEVSDVRLHPQER